MRPLQGRRHVWRRGQALVEFTIILPIILTMALSIAEFGVAFGTNMTLIQATREGARTGAILVDGSDALECPGLTGAGSVDPQIIAAVQRTIESSGSGITLANVNWIHIFKADANGNPVANSTNEWLVGGVVGAQSCGVDLHFHLNGTALWPASGRSNTLPVDSIGVSISYKYKLFTPLSALTGLFGASQITMIDSTVMALEP